MEDDHIFPELRKVTYYCHPDDLEHHREEAAAIPPLLHRLGFPDDEIPEFCWEGNDLLDRDTIMIALNEEPPRTLDEAKDEMLERLMIAKIRRTEH